MDKKKMRNYFLTVLVSCFSFLLSVAQPVVKTAVDKNEILIGDQLKLTIEASFNPEEYTITWPAIPDSILHFEVVNRSKMDSLYRDKKLAGLTQTITLTSFDSGKWVLPSFLLSANPSKDDTTYSFFTDSMPITVSFSTSDTTNRLRDIKPIREADTINNIWYWIGAGVLSIGLIIFLIWFYRYWKKNKISVPFQTKLTPYDEAVKELDKLKEYNLADAEEIRIVHTKLGEILKRYLSRRQAISYTNKTTGDLLIALRDQNLEKEMLTKAASSLRCGDAVKFAKYLPPVSESEACLQSIKEVINNINIQAPNNLNPKP